MSSFNGADGSDPWTDLTLRLNPLWDDAHGGADGAGTVFSIPVTGGTPTTLVSFTGSAGRIRGHIQIAP